MKRYQIGDLITMTGEVISTAYDSTGSIDVAFGDDTLGAVIILKEYDFEDLQMGALRKGDLIKLLDNRIYEVRSIVENECYIRGTDNLAMLYGFSISTATWKRIKRGPK